VEVRVCEGDLNPRIGTCDGTWIAVETPAILPLSMDDQIAMFDLWLPILITAFGANLIIRKVM
jgi:hypothetical protein